MSNVTNVILVWRCGENDAVRLADVNRFFAAAAADDVDDPAGNTWGFVSVEDASLPRHWYGGTKNLECGVAIGAFNYLDVYGLIAHVARVRWKKPSAVQLFVQEQDDERFRLIALLDPPVTTVSSLRVSS